MQGRTNLWKPGATEVELNMGRKRTLPAGIPLLLVSNFGIQPDGSCDASVLSAWCRITAAARSTGSAAIALIPATRSRWPRAIGIYPTHAFEWDLETSPGGVWRARRAAERDPWR